MIEKTDDPYGRRERCRCGKVAFDKKSAQSKKNWLENRGREKNLRIYQCPESDTWHLTSQQDYHKKK